MHSIARKHSSRLPCLRKSIHCVQGKIYIIEVTKKTYETPGNYHESKTTWAALTMNALSSLFLMHMIFFTSASIWQSYCTRDKWEDFRTTEVCSPPCIPLSLHATAHCEYQKGKASEYSSLSFYFESLPNVNAPFFFYGCMTFQQPCLV